MFSARISLIMREDQSTHGPCVLQWSGGSTAKGLVWLVRPGRLDGLGQHANTTTGIVHFSHPQEPSLESGLPCNWLLMNSYFCVRTLLKFLIFHVMTSHWIYRIMLWACTMFILFIFLKSCIKIITFLSLKSSSEWLLLIFTIRIWNINNKGYLLVSDRLNEDINHWIQQMFLEASSMWKDRDWLFKWC